MNPKLYPLPFDGTKEHPGNLVVNEYHDLTRQGNCENKVIVMDKGYFYKDTVVITDSKGNPLTPNVDYQITGFSSEAYKLTGLEVCSIIVLKLSGLEREFYVSAQMVGGRFCDVGDAISNKLLGLVNNTRKLRYQNIKDIPDTVELNMHMHPYWDLYSFTPRTQKIARMTDIYTGTLIREFDEAKQEFDDYMTLIAEEKNKLDSIYALHRADLNDPHRLEAYQVNKENVTNGPMAKLEAMHDFQESWLAEYISPAHVKEFINVNFVPVMQEHMDDKNNPHNDTAELVGTYSELELMLKNNLYYDRHSTTNETDRFGGEKDSNWNTTKQGKTFPVLYNELRSNLDASEIKSGLLDNSNFITNTPVTPSVLVTDNRSTFKWMPIGALPGHFRGKSSKIYNAYYNGDGGAHLVNVVNDVVNPALQEENTMMVVRHHSARYHRYGNAWTDEYFGGVALLSVKNGRWVI